MDDKFDKYWNDIHFYFPKIYGDIADEYIEHAHKLCYDLVKEYESKAVNVSGGQNVGLEISRSKSCSNLN